MKNFIATALAGIMTLGIVAVPTENSNLSISNTNRNHSRCRDVTRREI